MNKIIAVLLMSLSTSLFSQQAKVIDVPELEHLIAKRSHKIQVINFWATWCGPCIKELPYFESLTKTRSNEIEVSLVTVDFVQDLNKVNRFIDIKSVQSNVFLVDNIDYNSWIDKVDPSWSGAIPATLVINTATGKRAFVEKELQEGELETLISSVITN